MIGKLVEAFFRHKVLVLLPPIVIPMIVGPIALVMAPIYFMTWANIWVDRPTYLTYNDDWNRYNTPAQNQAGRLNELLRTRSFVVDVANKTPLAPLVGTAQGEEKIAEIFGKGLTIAPNGSQIVLVRFRAETPQLSYQVVNSLIETFKEKAATDRANQAALAISFYESRQEAAQEQFKKASDALRRYVAANPRLSSLDPGRGAGATTAARLGLPPAAIDPQLAELLRQLEVAEGDLNATRKHLDQAHFDASASIEGLDLGFQVVDPPQVPTAPVRERRRMLVYPAAGLVVGLGLSGIILLLLVLGDRSARSERDLDVPSRVVGAVPDVRLKKLRKSVGPDATRRAVGFVAGTALPAPGAAR